MYKHTSIYTQASIHEAIATVLYQTQYYEEAAYEYYDAAELFDNDGDRERALDCYKKCAEAFEGTSFEGGALHQKAKAKSN
jgi:hypothetical protein